MRRTSLAINNFVHMYRSMFCSFDGKNAWYSQLCHIYTLTLLTISPFLLHRTRDFCIVLVEQFATTFITNYQNGIKLSLFHQVQRAVRVYYFNWTIRVIILVSVGLLPYSNEMCWEKSLATGTHVQRFFQHAVYVRYHFEFSAVLRKTSCCG